jgi:uncharacterized protein (TIGR02284 family)
MPMKNEQIVEILNKLIKTGRDSRHMYKTAAEDVRFAEYNVLFQRYAEQRANFVTELQEEVRRLGGSPVQSGTVAGKLHQGWMEVKSIATGQDEGAMLNECALSEEATLKEYEEALEKDLPANPRSILDRQYRLIQEVYEYIGQLQDEMPYPDKLP